jgi:hypothetical protein
MLHRLSDVDRRQKTMIVASFKTGFDANGERLRWNAPYHTRGLFEALLQTYARGVSHIVKIDTWALTDGIWTELNAVVKVGQSIRNRDPAAGPTESEHLHDVEGLFNQIENYCRNDNSLKAVKRTCTLAGVQKSWHAHRYGRGHGEVHAQVVKLHEIFQKEPASIAQAASRLQTLLDMHDAGRDDVFEFHKDSDNDLENCILKIMQQVNSHLGTDAIPNVVAFAERSQNLDQGFWGELAAVATALKVLSHEKCDAWLTGERLDLMAIATQLRNLGS